MNSTFKTAGSLLFILLFAILVSSCGSETPQQPEEQTAYDYRVRAVRGEVIDLSEYKGEKVALFVNTASECGLTPQFAKLQELYETYKDQGLVIVGFSSNSFEGEPRSDEEIVMFCTDNYLVEFPITRVINVNPPEQHVLYEYLTSSESNPEFAGDISWNFEKFLIDRDGKVVARFSPETEPDDSSVIEAIESLL